MFVEGLASTATSPYMSATGDYYGRNHTRYAGGTWHDAENVTSWQREWRAECRSPVNMHRRQQLRTIAKHGQFLTSVLLYFGCPESVEVVTEVLADMRRHSKDSVARVTVLVLDGKGLMAASPPLTSDEQEQFSYQFGSLKNTTTASKRTTDGGSGSNDSALLDGASAAVASLPFHFIGALTTLRVLFQSNFPRFSDEVPWTKDLTLLKTWSARNVALRRLRPPDMQQLKKMNTIYLWGTRMTEVPPALVREPSSEYLLRVIAMYHHSPSYTSKGLTVPPELGRIVTLTDLFIQDSGITELPPTIGRLTNLQALRLNANRLAALPTEIGLCTRCE